MGRETRVLAKEIRDYLTVPSPDRDFLLGYIKERIGKGRESAALCFRGNKATVYYRSHQLLWIRLARGGIIGEFDFRHSRFSKDYKDVKKELENYGVDFSGFDENDKNKRHVRFCLSGSNAVTSDRLGKILEIYRRLIDDFLSKEKSEYAFDAPKNGKKKSDNREKDVQQEIYSKHFYDSAETYYDIEYTQHRAEEHGVAGRFDLLGLRREGERYALLFTELKSTAAACVGSAGIEKHEKDYLTYLQKTDLVQARKEEAVAVMRLLAEILGKPTMPNLSPENIDAKIQFLFTHDAAGYIDRVRSPLIERRVLDTI